MIITETIILVILVFLIVLITYFGIKLINKHKEKLSFDSEPLKETLIRMENDLKNNFTGLTSDQKEAISKWTTALEKLGNNDTSINNLRNQLEGLVKFSDEKFSVVNEKQSTNTNKLSEAFLKLEENLKNIDTLKTDVQSLNSIFIILKLVVMLVNLL
ncbi:hypothetical protein [Spiroplasma sp. AdecLV25b]|uniref:hypothetical protein n=1 Tax=Spiroplasma sp. AdecLV25b TaxID=3027162 RepID=UPI0027E08CEE|nr:hypothetical protein [Spiroplasma sp. AdecLV25b]